MICISETTCNDVQRFYDIDKAKIRVVPLSHSDVFRQLEEDHHLSVLPAASEPFIVYVGSRASYKHFDGLLSAYSVWPRRDEVGLVIVGGNLSTKEEERLEELGIRKRVYPIGDVDDETLCRVYNEATALVFPSLYEGFGIPLLEAMSCGCPIIASRIPSTVEIAGECAIYFNVWGNAVQKR